MPRSERGGYRGLLVADRISYMGITVKETAEKLDVSVCNGKARSAPGAVLTAFLGGVIPHLNVD